MYQIKRNHIVEELEIEDNGKVLKLSVDINVDSMLKAYNNAQYKIAQASIDAQKANDNKDMSAAEEAMGNAVLGLFGVIFGEEQTKQIIDFYDNKALEMLGDIAPFISDVVAPRFKEAQDRITERYKQVSKRGK